MTMGRRWMKVDVSCRECCGTARRRHKAMIITVRGEVGITNSQIGRLHTNMTKHPPQRPRVARALARVVP